MNRLDPVETSFLRWIYCLVALGILSACNSQVTDFVKGAEPSQTIDPRAINSPMALKVTPGKMKASSSDAAIEATVTATNKTFAAGSDMAVSLTISRIRVSPQ